MGDLLDPNSVPPVRSDLNPVRLRSATELSDANPKGIASYEGIPAYGLLQHAADQIPDHTAVVYGDQEWTFAELNQQSIRAAAMLQRLGVAPGDRVGILLPNVPEYIIAANAIWRAGGIAVAISPLMVSEEVQSLLKKTDCRVVICLDVLAHLVEDEGEGQDCDESRGSESPSESSESEKSESEKSMRVMSIYVSIRQSLPKLHQLGYLWMRRSRTGHWRLRPTEHCRWFWTAIEETQSDWQPVEITPASCPAYILPTGGTTGAPKAVTLSHTNMVANAWQQYQWAGGMFGTVTAMAVLPFFHSYGMSATIMGGFAMGAKLIIHHRFNTRQTIRLLDQHQPTVFHAVPAMLVVMNERYRKSPPKFTGLRWVISGGATLKEEIASEFSRHTGALVVEGYGLSEASPVTHVGPLFEDPHYGTIGKTLPCTECRIIDADGNEVPRGGVGQLTVRGPQVMLGYWNDQAATDEAIKDGWLRTGDLATLDHDGFYRIVGREKDLIITSGYNVHPASVEDAIRQHDTVQDVAVVGQPDERRGELVKAYIVLKPGAKWDEAALSAHCAEHLSKHKRPRLFEQWEGDLPRNFLGKVIRRKLREHSTAPTVSTNDSTE